MFGKCFVPRSAIARTVACCGYDNEIQRLCVGQKPRGIDQVYNHDEQWIAARDVRYRYAAGQF